MSGSMSEMKQVTGDLGIDDRGMNNHGAPTWYQTFKREDIGDISGDSGIPTSQFYSEGNGGEFRSSVAMKLGQDPVSSGPLKTKKPHLTM